MATLDDRMRAAEARLVDELDDTTRRIDQMDWFEKLPRRSQRAAIYDRLLDQEAALRRIEAHAGHTATVMTRIEAAVDGLLDQRRREREGLDAIWRRIEEDVERMARPVYVEQHVHGSVSGPLNVERPWAAGDRFVTYDGLHGTIENVGPRRGSGYRVVGRYDLGRECYLNNYPGATRRERPEENVWRVGDRCRNTLNDQPGTVIRVSPAAGETLGVVADYDDPARGHFHFGSKPNGTVCRYHGEG